MKDQPNWPELKFDFMNAAKDAIDEIRYSTPDSEEEEIWVETEFSIPLRGDNTYKLYIVAVPQTQQN